MYTNSREKEWGSGHSEEVMNSSQNHGEQPDHLSPHPHHRRHIHHHHHLLFSNPLAHSSPHPHHHHHHHHLHHLHYHQVRPHCALHNHFSHSPHFNLCPSLLSPPFRNPQPPVTVHPHPEASHQTQMLQDDGLEEFEEGDSEEPIFVMTDEWREFFAKSEARRREAKKLAKKQRKKLKVELG